MAGVKNRLKLFEPDEDPENMASTKPQTPLKPPIFGQNISPGLQKLLNKQNDSLGKEDQKSVSEEARSPFKKPPDTPAKGTRNGLGSGASAEHNENNTAVASVNKNVASRPPVCASKPTDSRKGFQVNVPDAFKQDSVNTTTLPEGRRGSQVIVPEVFKAGSKNPTALSEISSSDENKKPKPFAKPGSTFPRPPPGAKPPPSNPETSVTGNSAPSLSKTLNKKLSDTNPENNAHQTYTKEFTKAKLPALEQLQSKNAHSNAASSTISSFLSSQPPTSSEVKVTDLRSGLKSTKVQPAIQVTEKKAAIKPIFPSGTSLSNKKAGAEVGQTFGQHIPNSNGSLDSTVSSNSQSHQEMPALPSRFPGNQWKSCVQELKHQGSDVLERKSDSKKFKKIKLEASPSSSTPEKPVLPSNIDLTLVKQQYHRTLQTLQDSGNENVEEDIDEIYDDAISLENVVSRQPVNKRQSERISIIPDMSAEEEGALYDDGITPACQLPPSSPISYPPAALVPDANEVYVDAETERKEEELDQVYEDEETFALNTEKLEEDKKRRQKEEAEAKKKEEKERKEREKEEEKKRKKEEKERAKREKEEMQFRKRFNLTGTETSVGEGIIKQDVKGGVLGGLSLKKGQTITIVRLDNNPQNKWLIRSDTSMGYVESSNIEVDPSIIRQAMESNLSKLNDEEQPVYDDVPQDGHPNDLEDDLEIYEECP